MIKTCKILKGFDKVGDDDEGYQELGPESQHPETRGHSLQLAKLCHMTHKSTQKGQSLQLRDYQCGSLTENVINSTSVDMYKNGYDQFGTVCKLRRGTLYEQETFLLLILSLR